MPSSLIVPCCGHEQAEQYVDEGGLARARGADERERAAERDVEVDVVQGRSVLDAPG